MKESIASNCFEDYGISKIYSPDDGRQMGLEGMIEDVIHQCDFALPTISEYPNPMTLGEAKDIRKIARQITNAENGIVFSVAENLNKKTAP